MVFPINPLNIYPSYPINSREDHGAVVDFANQNWAIKMG